MFKNLYLYLILIVLLFSFFFIGCYWWKPGESDDSSVEPLKLISTTNGFYEANADNGSFSETITVSLPVGVDVSNAHQMSGSGVFDTDLQNPINPALPIEITTLADDLSVRLSTTTNTAGKVTTLKITLTGTANDHEGRDDNSTFTLTFGSNLFEVDEAVFATEDTSFTFDLNFILPRWSARRNFQTFAYDDKLWVLGGYDSGNKMIFGRAVMGE